MVLRAQLALAILFTMCMPSWAQATEPAQRIERLASVIATSDYGNIARTQATLMILCEAPGLSKALEDSKVKALVGLMEQKKVVWADGDTPELLNVLTTTMSLSYIQGLSRVASDTTATGKAVKSALCQAATKEADSILSGSSS